MCVVCVCVYVSLYCGTSSGARLLESRTGFTTWVKYSTSLCLVPLISIKRVIKVPSSKLGGFLCVRHLTNTQHIDDSQETLAGVWSHHRYSGFQMLFKGLSALPSGGWHLRRSKQWQFVVEPLDPGQQRRFSFFMSSLVSSITTQLWIHCRSWQHAVLSCWVFQAPVWADEELGSTPAGCTGEERKQVFYKDRRQVAIKY